MLAQATKVLLLRDGEVHAFGGRDEVLSRLTQKPTQIAGKVVPMAGGLPPAGRRCMTALPPASSPLVIDIDRPIRTGILAVVVGFFGFLLWASFAPITSAAVAPGVVVADSRNKDIQHLEGGIVHEVLVPRGRPRLGWPGSRAPR